MDICYQESETAAVAQSLLSHIAPSTEQATIVALGGDLGAGKTTLTKEIARILGVSVEVTSPTFVLARWYDTTDDRWVRLVHIDAYRIESLVELEQMKWDMVCAQPQTLVIVEWPERIHDALPASTVSFHIEHHGDERRITTL